MDFAQGTCLLTKAPGKHSLLGPTFTHKWASHSAPLQPRGLGASDGLSSSVPIQAQGGGRGCQSDFLIHFLRAMSQRPQFTHWQTDAQRRSDLPKCALPVDWQSKNQNVRLQRES